MNNKTILLTGASSGIGKALAFEISKYNCNLILIARRLEKLEEIKNKITNVNCNVTIYKCDVSNQQEVKEVALDIKSKFGFIDITILNAAVNLKVDLEIYNSQLAEETMNINFMGVVYWLEELLPDYIKNRKGIIVGVSSLADNRGYSVSGTYCASKAALSIYLEGLRIELSKYNIDVLTVKPGFVKTEMTAKNNFRMPFMISAERAAKYIIKGIKKKRKVIQFPFISVIGAKIIGGLPYWLYDFISKKIFSRLHKTYPKDNFPL